MNKLLRMCIVLSIIIVGCRQEITVPFIPDESWNEIVQRDFLGDALNWGMSEQEVVDKLDSEKIGHLAYRSNTDRHFKQTIPDRTSLIYDRLEFNDSDCALHLSFYKDSLIRIEYIFDDIFKSRIDNLLEFSKRKKFLFEKYGQPYVIRSSRKAGDFFENMMSLALLKTNPGMDYQLVWKNHLNEDLISYELILKPKTKHHVLTLINSEQQSVDYIKHYIYRLSKDSNKDYDENMNNIQAITLEDIIQNAKSWKNLSRNAVKDMKKISNVDGVETDKEQYLWRVFYMDGKIIIGTYACVDESIIEAVYQLSLDKNMFYKHYREYLFYEKQLTDLLGQPDKKEVKGKNIDLYDTEDKKIWAIENLKLVYYSQWDLPGKLVLYHSLRSTKILADHSIYITFKD